MLSKASASSAAKLTTGRVWPSFMMKLSVRVRLGRACGSKLFTLTTQVWVIGMGPE